MQVRLLFLHLQAENYTVSVAMTLAAGPISTCTVGNGLILGVGCNIRNKLYEYNMQCLLELLLDNLTVWTSLACGYFLGLSIY